MAGETNLLGKRNHESWRTRGWAVVLLLVACVAYWCGNAQPSSLPNAGLVVDDKYLNFGEAWQDSKFDWKLPIRNSAGETVVIEDFSTSCGCVRSIKPRSFMLEPGESQVVELTLDLTKGVSFAKGSWESATEAAIFPHIKGEPALQSGWTLTGRVRKSLHISPNTVSFADELIRTTPNKGFLTKKVRITTFESVDGLHASCEDNKAITNVLRQGPKEFEVSITPQSNLSQGHFTFRVFLKCLTRKDSIPGRFLRVQGFVHEEAELVPPLLFLGGVPVGNTIAETVMVTSRSGRLFKVDKWQTLSSNIKVRPMTSRVHVYR